MFFAENVIPQRACPPSASANNPTEFLSPADSASGRSMKRSTAKIVLFLRQAYDLMKKVQDQWQQLVGQVAHVDQPGDSFEKLLNMLGLNATSVDFARRIGTLKNPCSGTWRICASA